MPELEISGLVRYPAYLPIEETMHVKCGTLPYLHAGVWSIPWSFEINFQSLGGVSIFVCITGFGLAL